jgi:hypothetical protein
MPMSSLGSESTYVAVGTDFGRRAADAARIGAENSVSVVWLRWLVLVVGRKRRAGHPRAAGCRALPIEEQVGKQIDGAPCRDRTLPAPTKQPETKV